MLTMLDHIHADYHSADIQNEANNLLHVGYPYRNA